MKNFMKIGLFAILGLLIFTTGCTDDDPIVVGPKATLNVGADYPNQTFEPGSFLGPITVTFKAGDSDLNGVYVYRNGEKLSNSEFLVDEESKSGNPFNLTQDEKKEVTFDFAVKLRNDEVTDKYTFEIADENQKTAEVSLDLTTKIQGTPVEEFKFYLMWNKDGTKPGGLNLDADTPENASVRYDSPDAHIRDAGIDTDKPLDKNWIQKILPVNGAKLMPYTGSYDEITVKEQIAELYDQAKAVTSSDVVQEGDIFIVEKSGKFYILLTTKVSVTTSDNNDMYEFSLKR